jgi:hypothetical protein
MSRWTTALQKHLEEMVRLQERLARAVESRLKAMTERDTARLEAALGEERRLGLALFEEERRRQVTMIHLAGELGVPQREIASLTVSAVAARLGAAAGAPLLVLRDRLHRVAGEIQRTNQTSLKLAQRFLPHFEELLSILLEGTVGQSVYTPGGQAARVDATGLNVVDICG